MPPVVIVLYNLLKLFTIGFAKFYQSLLKLLKTFQVSSNIISVNAAVVEWQTRTVQVRVIVIS